MPSPEHDGLGQFFKDDPQLAVKIARDILGIDVPATPLVREENPVFNTRNSDDLIGDAVFSFGPPKEPAYGIVLEVQQDRAKDPVQLAKYAAAAWLLLKCDIIVLVVCLDQLTADYYSKPIKTGIRGFSPFEADVVGPRDIPRITHHAHARDFPGLAAISVAVHGDREVVNAFVDALRDLPEECRPRYYEYTHKLARAEAQALLEERMHSAPWIVSSPFAREHFGRGRAEGKAEGKAEGEAKAILLVLKSRDISISAEDAERISACTDLPQLEVWATRAAKATSIEDVLH